MYGKSSLMDLIITFCLNVTEIQNERKKLLVYWFHHVRPFVRPSVDKSYVVR